MNAPQLIQFGVGSAKSTFAGAMCHNHQTGETCSCFMFFRCFVLTDGRDADVVPTQHVRYVRKNMRAIIDRHSQVVSSAQFFRWLDRQRRLLNRSEYGIKRDGHTSRCVVDNIGHNCRCRWQLSGSGTGR